MKAIIIDDEVPAQRWLKKQLDVLRPDIRIEATLGSVEEAVAWFRRHGDAGVDVVFADIRLGDGTTFDVADMVPIDVPVIFTTAYDEYAMRAFTLNSVDYLLKPVHTDDLARALAKLESMRAVLARDTSAILADVRRMMDHRTPYRERYCVEVGDQLVTIPVRDIAFVYSEFKITHMVTHAGRRHVLPSTLDEVDHELEPNSFIRVSRKYIVSIDSIVMATMLDNGILRLQLRPDAPHDVTVSRERVPNFKRWFGR